MRIPSHGGNSYFDVGQITMDGATGIVIPPPSEVRVPELQSMVLRITGAAHDCYFGKSATVSDTTGCRIPANTVYPMTSPRRPVYVFGSSGDVVTYCYEWN